MKITTKGRYAVTAMLDLAVNRDQGHISLADISGRQGISLSYLEQLFARLRRNTLVKSARGPGGGYQLGRSADSISVGQIIQAVNENVDVTHCKGRKDCHDQELCISHHLWEDLSAQVFEFLNGITLADVIQRHAAKQNPSKQGEYAVDLKMPQGRQSGLEHSGPSAGK
jgi:Rrf2 family iron-sulfur cluster assembly transcriptional regulator